MSQLTKLKRRLIAFSISLLLVMAGCNGDSTAPGLSANADELCPLGDAVETDGHRRLALVVGVGVFENSKITALPGTANDARRFYDLLTGKNGYGFPKQNVCLLLDEQATMGRFKQSFGKALVERARPNDTVVIFYAGHGSQTRDKNGDENDKLDETWILHDSRSNGVRDLIDDELNSLLASLYEKTKFITMFADSCNSGSVLRGDKGTYKARFFDFLEDDEDVDEAEFADAKGDGAGVDWIPESMPGLVVFTAASDGTAALESKDPGEEGGVFTDALIQVLSQVGDQPLTYAQAARQIPSLIAAKSYQIPYFHGDLDRPVFGNTTRKRPISWELTEVGEDIKITGPPMAGMGIGAELRVYDGAMSGADTRDPAKAKATLIVNSMSGLNARAHITAAPEEADSLAIGDLAIMVRPANKFLKIKVRIRPLDEPGGIPRNRATALRRVVEQDTEANLLVELSEVAGDYELALNVDGELQLYGPENKVRITYSKDSNVPRNLWQHARQRALLSLQGEGGSYYTDNKTLMVDLLPAANQDQCTQGGWQQAEPNIEQVIPLCHKWNIRVALSKDSPTSLLVGGVVLSTDGNSYGFPRDRRRVRLQPGEQVTFLGRGETFRGLLPLDVQDRILVFGTREDNPVDWSLLTSAAEERTRGSAGGSLYKALNSYLKANATRGAGVVDDEEVIETSPWTMSSLVMRVEANQRFLNPDSQDDSITKREYTINNFNINPYLPDDEQTKLYKVLDRANWLANASATDGIGYKQHAWNKATDMENLNLGIDCSRTMWFIFTRTGLPYNRSDKYLPTAQMFGENSMMNDEFTNCTDDLQFKLGDVLVYRDEERGDGHTVMVIDPVKKISFGSMGWDGNPRILPDAIADTGVEFQKTIIKPDLRLWDRKTMMLKACWRYRAFTEEAKQPGGNPGTKAMVGICDPKRRCGAD